MTLFCFVLSTLVEVVLFEAIFQRWLDTHMERAITRHSFVGEPHKVRSVAVFNSICLGSLSERTILLQRLRISLINSALGFVYSNGCVIRVDVQSTNDIIPVRSSSVECWP